MANQRMRLQPKLQLKITAIPRHCFINEPAGLVKAAASSPQIPTTPCTEMAPTGSSMRNLSIMTMAGTTTRPPMIPITVASPGGEGSRGVRRVDWAHPSSWPKGPPVPGGPLVGEFKPLAKNQLAPVEKGRPRGRVTQGPARVGGGFGVFGPKRDTIGAQLGGFRPSLPELLGLIPAGVQEPTRFKNPETIPNSQEGIKFGGPRVGPGGQG